MPRQLPPTWAIRLLRWFCPEQLLESIEGDLMEQFAEDCTAQGARKARSRFIIHVIRFFRPSILLRHKFAGPVIRTIMINNYLKVASRNIQRQKLYSLINAIGLSIGIAFCLLIYLYIEDERSFDQFHANKDLIYRIQEKSFDTWEPDPEKPYQESAWIQLGVGPAVKTDLAEVEYACRFNSDGDAIVRYQDKALTEEVTYTDADFFKMFSFGLLAGNPDKLFQNKSDVVITPAIAEKYFGKEDPMGKTISIEVEGEKSFIVAGIIEAPPSNSSLDFQILIPQENRPYYDKNLDNWGNFNTPTFVQLRANSSLESFRSNMAAFADKRMGDRMEKWRKRATIPIPDGTVMFEYKAVNLSDIHLLKDIAWHKVSDPQYSIILGSVALLILVIACINYISLALTTSAARRTEVGIRKVVGAQNGQLVSQFAIESVFLAVLSMIAGLGLAALFLPSFNEFTGKGIQLLAGGWWRVLAFTTGLSLVVGLIAGSYPAFFLSRFQPSQVLKGGHTSRVRAGFAQPLVVLQFALSSFLIICSVIMYRQMKFIATKDLGYNQHQVLVLPTQKGWGPESDKTVEQLRARLAQEPDVISVSGTSSSFNRGWSRYGFKVEGEQKSAYVYAIDPYYIPTLDIKLVMGRNFDPGNVADTAALIVNESMVKEMKWTDPLNSFLNWKEDSLSKGSPIIGVAKDYHFRSLEADIDPMILSIDTKYTGHLGNMLIKISPTNIPATVDKLRTTWKEMYPDRPFDSAFLDEDVAKQYKSYTRWMSIMGLSTGFAILISCLGLFGLAGINAVNRTKEIGIRKVMGAELSNIFILLNRPFVVLSLVAFLIAAPASWYVITELFLADFKFKVTVGWELFAVSILLGMGLALLTVSYHAVKAALSNPAETLKYE